MTALMTVEEIEKFPPEVIAEDGMRIRGVVCGNPAHLMWLDELDRQIFVRGCQKEGCKGKYLLSFWKLVDNRFQEQVEVNTLTGKVWEVRK